MFNYKWKLKEGYPETKNGLKVFSTFACGGGSTMGYKLAGYDVIGANDIDPQMAKVYKKNHNPKHYYLCDIRELVEKIKKKEVTKELFDLDILDGSPPCSVFSVAGKREAGWGKEKVFREGQAKQRLDDLFFDFISVAKELQPKVVIAENVKGLIKGNAKGYVVDIVEALDQAGYNTQLFCLNSATMGVPQKKERVFFIASRKNLLFGKIKLNFNEKPIPYKEIRNDLVEYKKITPLFLKYYQQSKQGGPVGKFNSIKRLHNDRPANTIAAGHRHFDSIQPRNLSDNEVKLAGSFPIDYDSLDVDINYLVGMSVPPLMVARIAEEIKKQWF